MGKNLRKIGGNGNDRYIPAQWPRIHSAEWRPAIQLFACHIIHHELRNAGRDRRIVGEATEGGEKEVCGWLKDKYGVSWQIVPAVLGEMIRDTDAEKTGRVMKALLQMTKIDIQTLQQTYGNH